LDLGSGQPLHDHHRGTTVRTEPEITRWMTRGRFWFRLQRYRAKGCEAPRQKLSSASIGEEPEVADADETLREQVEQEAAQELVER
jgi:hypothetical protein